MTDLSSVDPAPNQPPIEVLRAAREWAAEHNHQTPDDRMLAIVYAAGVAAGRTAAAQNALVENERLHAELAHWRSGRRTRGVPLPESVPDGLHYAAKLVRAQGAEGGEEHDSLLREASMRLKALHELASKQQDELAYLREDLAAAHAAGRTAAPASGEPGAGRPVR